MNKQYYWVGHVLSGNSKLLAQFHPALATAVMRAALSGQTPSGASLASQPSTSAPTGGAATSPPDPDGLRAACIWLCALKVLASNFSIDANDPDGSLGRSIDWKNSATDQPAIIAIYIDQEAPAVAEYEGPQYKIQWKKIKAAELSNCPTVGDVLTAIHDHYS